MNCYLFVFATIFVVVNARVGRQGWGIIAPQPGWSAPTTLPPSGWSVPPPPPPNTVTINIAGDLAAEGDGWAASSQDLVLEATSDHEGSEDPSVVSQSGLISQSSGINPLSAVALQTADVNQVAYGTQGFGAFLYGPNSAAAIGAGWSGAAGNAQSSADGYANILVNRP